VVDRPMPRASSRRPISRLAASTLEPVEEIRIDDRPGADIGLVGDGEDRPVRAGRQHHGQDRQPILAREVEVALVMRRAAEDRARA